MNHSIGIRSLAVSFPNIIRTNDYWLEKFPQLMQQAPRKARLFKSASTEEEHGLDIWSQAVAPYLSDPFRGNVERRVVDANESSLILEYRTAKDAIAAAQLLPGEIDLTIVASLFPEQVGHGNAAYLAHQLELQCPAWNLESTCSSALVALQNAQALILTGAYRNVLVVVSHISSKTVHAEDTLSWAMGDGAGAFIVTEVQSNQGILGTKIVNTAATSGAYLHELVTDTQGNPKIRTRVGANASTLAETAVDFVRTCCEGAITAAGVTLDQIDFFAFNTPTAWYANVCTQALGIDPERTINLYPRYANIGTVFPIANLYHAAQSGKICQNDLVLVYTNGASATAAATVMRWGDVALGVAPAPPISVTPQKKTCLTADKLQPKSSISKTLLLAAYPEARRKMLESYLLGWMSSSLQLPLSQIHQEQSFASLIDSLMAFLLKSQIEVDLGLQVPMENFFGENNIAQLIDLLLDRLAILNLTSSVTRVDREREKLSL